MGATAEDMGSNQEWTEEALDGTTGNDDPGAYEGDDGVDLVEMVKGDAALAKHLRESAERILDLEAQRKAINEEKKAIVESVVAKGINRHGFEAAMRRYKLTEADREERELSYQASCVALGVEHQLDMFKEIADNMPRGLEGSPSTH